MINLKIKLNHELAKVPTKDNFADAGWDLYSVEDVVIHTSPFEVYHDTVYDGEGCGEKITHITPNGVTVVRTGVHIQIPKGYVGFIWDRSGMACNFSIHRVAGVIDSGYTGEIKIGLTNLGKPYHIKAGDKIAQIVIQEIPLHINWEIADELYESDRGERGFGSSGR